MTNQPDITIRIKPSDRKKLSKVTLERLVYFATRAPSGHNSQPWTFRFTDDAIEVHPDFSRELEVVDPDHREIYISLGCAAENLMVAASHFNLKAHAELARNAQQMPFIRVQFKWVGETPDDPLFETIEMRQTNRRIYDSQRLTKSQVGELRNLAPRAGVFADLFENGTAEFDKIAGRILAGDEIQMRDKRFKKELAGWVRFNRRQERKSNDGLSYKVMDSPPIPGLIGRWILDWCLTPERQAVEDLKKIRSSSHFLVVSTVENNVEHWISAGQTLQRILLTLARIGVSAAHMNPPCEIPELRKQLAEIIGRREPMIILRLGFAAPTTPSPRRSVDEVIEPPKQI